MFPQCSSVFICGLNFRLTQHLTHASDNFQPNLCGGFRRDEPLGQRQKFHLPVGCKRGGVLLRLTEQIQMVFHAVHRLVVIFRDRLVVGADVGQGSVDEFVTQ